jgi:hypothetical protein
MPEITFNDIWKKIVSNEGNLFNTKNGEEFTYNVNNNIITTSRTEWNIPKNDFERVFNLLPIDGPGQINKIVQGPSYIWAILNDDRIIDKRALLKEGKK